MSKILPWSMILLSLIGTGVHAAGMKWDHEENIKQGIALFDDAYKQGGMTEAENLSKKCHKKFQQRERLATAGTMCFHRHFRNDGRCADGHSTKSAKKIFPGRDGRWSPEKRTCQTGT